MLANSAVFQRAQAGNLLPDRKKTICVMDMPLVIPRDPACPLPWLIKPFVDYGGITAQQKTLNYSLSRARIVVENAFGRLKEHGKCLLTRNDTITEDIPTVISACCVTGITTTGSSCRKWLSSQHNLLHSPYPFQKSMSAVPQLQHRHCVTMFTNTVFVTIELPFYARATGTVVGIAQVQVCLCQECSYGRARSTATGVEWIRL